jgi:hypothetical protein
LRFLKNKVQKKFFKGSLVVEKCCFGAVDFPGQRHCSMGWVGHIAEIVVEIFVETSSYEGKIVVG